MTNDVVDVVLEEVRCIMNIGLLLLRLVIGLTFAAHGSQKLFGWFGGPGLERTGEVFE